MDSGYRFGIKCGILMIFFFSVCYAHSIVKRDVERSVTYCGAGYPPLFFCPQPGQGDEYTMCCKYEMRGKEQYDCCSPLILAGWLIGVIVVACVIVVAVITACICCCCGCCGCLSASRPGYVIIR